MKMRLLTAWLFLLLVPFSVQAIEFKPEDQIAVLSGQSFSIWPWRPSGYMHLIREQLINAGMKTTPIFLDSQKTSQMLEAIDEQVIAKKPVYVLIIPGTADYNPWENKPVEDAFNQNLEAVLTKLQAANIKTVLVTSYADNGNLAVPSNQNVGPHNDAIRALAKNHGLPLIDFVSVMDAQPKVIPFDGSLVAKSLANEIFAAEVLRSIGFGDQQVAALREAWMDTPGAVQLAPSVSVNTYAKLKEAAKATGQDVGDYMTAKLEEAIK